MFLCSYHLQLITVIMIIIINIILLLLLLLVRIAATAGNSGYCYTGVAWSVGLSVILSVGHFHEPCKNG